MTMLVFTPRVCIFAAIMVLVGGRALPNRTDEAESEVNDTDTESQDQESVVTKEDDSVQSTGASSTELLEEVNRENSDVSTPQDSREMFEAIKMFVGDMTLEDELRESNKTAEEILKIVALLSMRTDPPLTEEELAYLMCFVLCGLGTCPPSCPAYYDPPWGPLEEGPMFKMTERYFQLNSD